MSKEYSEDGLVEQASEQILDNLGWTVVTAWHNETFAEDDSPEARTKCLLGRTDKGEVILQRDLLATLKTLNKGLPETAYLSAIDQLVSAQADKSLAVINKEKHELMTKGVQVSYQDDKGVLQKPKLKIFDFNNPENNRFLAVRQLEVAGEYGNKRPDIVAFVNGIPLVFFELKAHHTDLRNAFTDNLSDYKRTIPRLFYCNVFIILSNGVDARVGTITSPYKYFLEWKRIEEEDEGVVSLDTMLRGTCDKRRLLDLFENFTLFDGEGEKTTKLMAKNHQYIGVNRVVEKARNLEDLKGKLGVFWHTQGSGKSYSIVFLCQKILRKFGGSYTFLIVVDRSELENQIYDTFTGVGAVTEENVRAKNRQHLRNLLQENHRYVFTLIHKFSVDKKKETEYPKLTDRSNIIVISDEAHRTQGGEFAGNMRYKGIRNASYLGFTGTPIIKDEEELTKNIFGGYVSVYDFKRAIDDNATLPLRYLNRGEKLGIENPNLDERMAEIINGEDLDDDQRRKLQREFARDYPILTADDRLDAIAKDLVWHFNDRGYQGKAMYVALDKPTAVRMYNLVMKYWPEYVADLKQRIQDCDDEQEALILGRHLKRVEATEVCVVVSSEQNELQKFEKLGLDIAPHRKKIVARDLEKEFKDENNPFRLAFVCAMWITGFDAPCVSTVYLDKPITGHTLMQTIARANRVYDDEKENGLIVDYGNVYQQLEKAYSVYGEGKKGGSSGGKDKGGGEERSVELLQAMAVDLGEAIMRVREFLQEVNFDLDTMVNAPDAVSRLAALSTGSNAICLNEATRARFEIAARDVFRKYKALYPEPEAEPYTPERNAINAIYGRLNQKTKSADISHVMRKLQQEVNMSVSITDHEVCEDDYVDLGNLDFDRLRAAFAKSKSQNEVMFDLQQAIGEKLEQMVQQNPLRLEFYEKYQKIIEEYNNGKDIHAVQKAFDDVNTFIEEELTPEIDRAAKENLTEESLALYDLLKEQRKLTSKEEKGVKKVIVGLLNTLKEEKLKVDRWRESPQVRAQIKTIILDSLPHLPQEPYPDEDLEKLNPEVFQHIYSNYQGAGLSTYGDF